MTVIAAALGAQLLECSVDGPLGDEVTATIALHGGTAYVEAAQACGLALLAPEDRNPEETTSAGVGQLIKRAIEAGATKVVVGLGGTATNDGARACWPRWGPPEGPMDCGPHYFRRLRSVDIEPARAAVAGVELIVATDVDNPLLGIAAPPARSRPRRAPMTRRCCGWSRRWSSSTPWWGGSPTARIPRWRWEPGRRGGLGYGLMLLGGQRVPGISTVMKIVGLRDLVIGSDVVVTGEGSFDWQSLRGKVVSGVATEAVNDAKPCVVIAGQVAVGRRDYAGIGVAAAYSVSDICGGVEVSLADPAGCVRQAAARVARTWSSGVRLPQRPAAPATPE